MHKLFSALLLVIEWLTRYHPSVTTLLKIGTSQMYSSTMSSDKMWLQNKAPSGSTMLNEEVHMLQREGTGSNQ